ncbi:MAG: hypothetical protein ACR2IF_13215 [Terriglobales bacterium]
MRYPSGSNEELKAPKSQFRVVGIDVEDSQEFEVGTFETLEAARQAATGKAGIGNPVYVYDDAGELRVRLGSWH